MAMNIATTLITNSKKWCKFISTQSSSANSQSSSTIISYYFSLLTSSPTPTHLRHLHARLLRSSLYSDVILSSKLVLKYSQLNKLTTESLSVFFHMPERNIYSWNIIIGEFSRSNHPNEAVYLFLKMWRNSGIRPNDFTLPLVFRACAGSEATQMGVSVHGLSLKLGFEVSLFVASALVFMYVNFGKIDYARVLFDEMPERDSVLWTAMLAGYAQHGEPSLSLEVFKEMVGFGVELDGVVMMSLLLVCGQLNWLKNGKSVHSWCIRRCLDLHLNLENAIVDMYVKCATLNYAHKVFDKMITKDVISWSSLILGYGLTGNVSVALNLFDQMRENNIKLNDVTFLGVLSACAHGGLVDRARSCFKLMEECGVVPKLKHYSSMIDCLARAGFLEEAERILEEMPIEPDDGVFGAVLSGCRVHNNVEVGERIALMLIGLKPEKSGCYVLLSNIYAEAGRFDEAERVRDLMKGNNVCKIGGRSLIETEECFNICKGSVIS